MKKLIRSIVNWAYGCNLALELHILRESCDNLRTIIEDYMIAQGARGIIVKDQEDK